MGPAAREERLRRTPKLTPRQDSCTATSPCQNKLSLWNGNRILEHLTDLSRLQGETFVRCGRRVVEFRHEEPTQARRSGSLAPWHNRPSGRRRVFTEHAQAMRLQNRWTRRPCRAPRRNRHGPCHAKGLQMLPDGSSPVAVARHRSSDRPAGRQPPGKRRVFPQPRPASRKRPGPPGRRKTISYRTWYWRKEVAPLPGDRQRRAGAGRSVDTKKKESPGNRKNPGRTYRRKGNGHRNRLWKVELQRFADRTGLIVEVCHLPPGTSKWNEIEHRLFCHITRNWQGIPLETHEMVVNLIGGTRTTQGLKVHAWLDEREHPRVRKVTDAEFDEVRIRRSAFQGDWNREIHPRKKPGHSGR